MGIFDKVFRRGYPSAAWTRREPLSLEFDFDRTALNGVGIGDGLEGLSFLGPAEDAPAAQKELLRYFSLGLEIRCAEGRVAELTLVWADSMAEGYRPFAGLCRRRGHVLGFSPETSEGDVTLALGQPHTRREARDEESGALEELTLSYSLANIEWEVALGPDGRLLEIHTRRGG